MEAISNSESGRRMEAGHRSLDSHRYITAIPFMMETVALVLGLDQE